MNIVTFMCSLSSQNALSARETGQDGHCTTAFLLRVFDGLSGRRGRGATRGPAPCGVLPRSREEPGRGDACPAAPGPAEVGVSFLVSLGGLQPELSRHRGPRDGEVLWTH